MEIHYMTVLWGIVPSVASKHSSCAPSAMPPPDPTDPITALTAALVQLLPNQPLISLVTPSFDWNTMEQYDYFQLFHKSVESWFTLQNIPAETPGDSTAETNSTRLEYVLNFLGNTGLRKFDCWKPTGTADEIGKKKKQASAFMDYLSSMMDHAVSQCCRIYQLEDVRIWPGESPDELIDHLWALADWCNFPTEDKKEGNIQDRFVRALSDKELIKKLLALDLTATTSRMLEVCSTHIAISDNLEAMGLRNRKQSMPYRGKTNLTKEENLQQAVCTHVDAAQSLTHLADHHSQQGMTTAEDVEN